MSTVTQSQTARRSSSIRLAIPLVVLLGAFLAGRFLSTPNITGVWAGECVDQIGRPMHMTLTLEPSGRELLSVQFLSEPDGAPSPPPPPPKVYRGTYSLEKEMLVQDLESSSAIPEGTFFDRPLHGTKVPTREMRCMWRVYHDKLYLSALTPVNVVLNRVQ